MRSADEWFEEYGESHRNPVNKLIHWVCVPMIFWSVIAILWEIPVPNALAATPLPVNWAVLVAVLVLAWYFLMNRALAAGMLIITALCLWIAWAVDVFAAWPLWLIAVIVFVLAWTGQFLGHRIEGRKPSFFKDLQFLLIGPAWLLGFVYRRFGISY